MFKYYRIQKETLDALADAVLAKTGGSEKLSIQQILDLIASLGTGGGENLDAVIAEQEELIAEIRTELAKKAAGSGDVSYYDGEYTVTPKADEEQILPTQGKLLTEDVVIQAIPYAEVSNGSGTAVYIGVTEEDGSTTAILGAAVLGNMTLGG